MSDLSRVEQLLRNALGEDIYEVTPQSRVEALLVELNELIEEMGSSVSPEAIATAVSAYLDEHLTNPTNPPVDTSLAIAGAAADAKKTGDEIGTLKEGLREDIRQSFAYADDATITEYIRKRLREGYALTNRKYIEQSSSTRLCVTQTLCLPYDLLVVTAYGYSVSIEIWTDSGDCTTDAQALNYVGTSGWDSVQRIVPKGTFFTLQFRDSTNAQISVEQVDKIRFINMELTLNAINEASDRSSSLAKFLYSNMKIGYIAINENGYSYYNGNTYLGWYKAIKFDTDIIIATKTGYNLTVYKFSDEIIKSSNLVATEQYKRVYYIPAGTWFAFRIAGINSESIPVEPLFELTVVGEFTPRTIAQNKLVPTLYDICENVYDGYYLEGYSLNTSTGEAVENAGFCVTDYIPVLAGKYYYDSRGGFAQYNGSGFKKICFYDGDFNFLFTTSFGNNGTPTEESALHNSENLRAPVNGFIRLQSEIAYIIGKNDLCVFEVDAPILTYGELPEYVAPLNINHKKILSVIERNTERVVNLERYSKTIFAPADYIITAAAAYKNTIRGRQLAAPLALSIGFLTDLHYSDVNDLNKIINDDMYTLDSVASECEVPYVIFGGDNVNESPSKAQHLEKMYKLSSIIKAYDAIASAFLMGNHDDSSITGYDSATDKYKTGYNVDNGEYYAVFFKQNENRPYIKMAGSDRDHLYFYIDFPSQRIRIICLNSTDITYMDDGGGNLIYNGQHDTGFSNEQLNWVVNEALNFDTVEAPDDWAVITMQHITDLHLYNYSQWYVDENHNGQVMWSIFNAFQNRTAYSFTRESGDYACSVDCDFTSVKQSIICRITGHTHADRSYFDETNHILYISTRCAGTRESYDEPGTANESAFDIFTFDRSANKIYADRFGSGDSREFSY